MITPMDLQDGINDFLDREVASKYMLKTIGRDGSESLRHPQIIRSGWVLPKSVDEKNSESVFPYITTRIERIENVKSGMETIVTILIIFGVYDPGVYDDDGKLVDDGSGYRSFWNLIETTRQAIFINHTIDNKYRVVIDFFEAEMLDEQSYPYWEGLCKTKWHVMFPTTKLGEEFYSDGG